MNVSCVEMKIHLKKTVVFILNCLCYSHRIYLFGLMYAEHGHLLGFTTSCVPSPKKSLLLLFPQHFLPLLKPLARLSQTQSITESRKLDSLHAIALLPCFWKLALYYRKKKRFSYTKLTVSPVKKTRLNKL